jgi:hypothetical protein
VTDEIVLTFPREPGFDGVAHLVLSGLAVRLNLTIENLEDLQIALDSVLGRNDEGGDVTVVLKVGEGELEARIAPVTASVLEALERREKGLDIRRVLDSTVDDVLVVGDSVLLTKKVTLVDA